jgi:molybdenum cofactor cytidylyltransferase
MQFGSIPLASAQGAILAHSVRVEHRVFRKGRILSDEDIAALAAAGHRDIMAARLEADDVDEDSAAHRIVRALCGPGTRAGQAFTGRANLYGEVRGLVRIDAARIVALNALHESLTVATLPPFAPVGPRSMLATVKIIPYAAPASVITDAEALLGDAPALHIAPFRPKGAALLSTMFDGSSDALLVKTRSSIAARLEAAGSKLAFEQRVAHRVDHLAQAIAAAHAAGADPIVVFGASAISDRRDVVPAAIEAAGGRVERFGMPVDPGNLILLGRLGDAVVIGAPGCARSPKLNGFDFVLQRVLADIPVGSHDIAAMGVGGLLTEIHTRPQPRERHPQTAPQAPHIAAIVLAAGLSSRMGRNKLESEIAGRPLVRVAVEAACASAAGPIIVVTGKDASRIEALLGGLPVSFVRNPDFTNGLSTSLICGIDAVPESCDGALVLLGDMPAITPELIDRLIAAFAPDEARAVCVASWRGRRGNPVLWSRQFFPDIRLLEGDAGAKSLIAANGELVCEVDAGNDAPLLDIDTPDMLAAYRERAQ